MDSIAVLESSGSQHTWPPLILCTELAEPDLIYGSLGCPEGNGRGIVIRYWQLSL